MTSAFRVFPRIWLDTNHEQIVIIDNSQVYAEPKEEDQPKEEEKEEPVKGGKGKAPEPEAEGDKEPEPDKITTDFEILKSNTYLIDKNDIKQTMKSASELKDELEENTFVVISKSSLCIYRLEDVIFTLYPHLAGIRRKGINTKELFSKEDPDKMSIKQSKELDNSNLQASFTQNNYDNKSSYSKKTGMYWFLLFIFDLFFIANYFMLRKIRI